MSFPCLSKSFFMLVQWLYNSFKILIILLLSSKLAVNKSMLIIISIKGILVVSLLLIKSGGATLDDPYTKALTGPSGNSTLI